MTIETPSYVDIQAASVRIRGEVVYTPVVSSVRINGITGLNLFLKDETAQKTRSFKDRGANNRLRQMSEAERQNGVVAYSSGNHAQAIAYVARSLGMSAILVMPMSAPEIKKNRVRESGGEIIEYDIKTQSREDIGAMIAKRDGRVLVPAYEDFDIVAGQGTCGKELVEHMIELGIVLDGVVVPAGGGGLCAGIGLSLKALSPQTKLFGAEPIEHDDHYQSLQAGHRVKNIGAKPSLCDALLAPTPGAIPFALHQKNLNGVLRVSDDECLLAMQLVLETTGIALEPGGAAAIAGVLSGRHDFKPGSNIGVILSGGNVDPDIQMRAEQCASALSNSPAG